MAQTIQFVVYIFLLLMGSALIMGVSADGSCVAPDGTVSGEMIGDICSCFSGYSSGGYNFLNCTERVPIDCEFNPTSTLSTDYIPQLVEKDSFIQNNILRVVIQSPLVTDRLNASIRFVSEDTTIDNSICSYPGPYWKKDVTTCNDMFIFEVTLAELSQCGWTRTEDSEYIYLTIASSIGQRDKIGELRDSPITRLTESTMRIQLRFPKSLTIYSAIEVSSSVNLLAAITYQAVDALTFHGRIELTTSLQWPYKLIQVLATKAPGSMTANTTIEDNGCSSSNGALCSQKVTMDIMPNGACQLTGDYQMVFKLGCRGSDPCPLESKTSNATIHAIIKSEDFCNALVFDIDLSGTLQIFQDVNHLQPKSAFLDDQVLYFLVTVGSTKAAIITTNITNIYYKPTETLTSKSLLIAGVPTVLARENKFKLDPPGQTTATFELTAHTGSAEGILFTVSPDSIEEFQFFAEVEVSWAVSNTFGAQQRHARFIVQTGAEQSLAGAQTKMFATPVNIASFRGDTPISPLLPEPLGQVVSSGWLLTASRWFCVTLALLVIL